MTDYDATLDMFFDEIILFLNRKSWQAADKQEYDCVLNNVKRIKAIKKNPRKYAEYNARIADDLVEDAEAFMTRNGRDNSVFMLYSKFIWNHMQNLYSNFDYQRRDAQQGLEKALKAIKYINSKNVLKSLIYPLLPNDYFNAKITNKQNVK